MAGTGASVRKASNRALSALAVALAALAAPVARAGSGGLDTPHGSTAGLVSDDPAWGLGLQIGNYGASSLVAQRVGFYGGALNLGLGLAYNSAYLSGDYLVFLTEGFRYLSLQEVPGYNWFRGQLNPYFGGGLQVGRGVSLRLPIGLQYTMLRDPFTFYGGLTLMLGRIFSDQPFGAQLWFNLGARVLL